MLRIAVDVDCAGKEIRGQVCNGVRAPRPFSGPRSGCFEHVRPVGLSAPFRTDVCSTILASGSPHLPASGSLERWMTTEGDCYAQDRDYSSCRGR